MTIIRDWPHKTSSNRRRAAGHAAEQQMAYYLRHEFGSDDRFFVVNDIRIEDPKQPGIANQIDHLVVHRYGAAIIESKSVVTKVRVTPTGEWSRLVSGRWKGMQSPIEQARRQAKTLHALWQANAKVLRGRVLLGMVQAGFEFCPIDLYVAISDEGIIERGARTAPRAVKADQVCGRIRREWRRHHAVGRPLSTKPDENYGVWAFRSLDEARRAAEFLVERHTPATNTDANTDAKADANTSAEPAPPPTPASRRARRSSSAAPPTTPTATPTPAPAAAPSPPPTRAPTRTPTRAPTPAASRQHTQPPDRIVCKSCGNADVEPRSGKYGYYVRCPACNTNTAFPKQCSACGEFAKVSKRGDEYRRQCTACGVSEIVWRTSAA